MQQLSSREAPTLLVTPSSDICTMTSHVASNNSNIDYFPHPHKHAALR